MTRSDDAILEFLLNAPARPLRATPRVISANIDFSIRTTRRRVGKLRDAGLIRYYNEKSALYEITEKGEAYLAGELSKDDLDLSE
jgi:predicted transcriptional regulator